MGLEWLRFIGEEIRFLKSFRDARNLYGKLPYLVPRLTGRSFRTGIVPLSLQIEPTNLCNIGCICCSRNRMQREKGFMDFGLFQKIVDDAARSGIKRIHLYLHGEPLLHPRIMDMIGYIKTKGIGIQMATNGMLFDRHNADALLRSGVDSSDHIIFSVMGDSKKVHEEIMKGVDHDKVIGNILALLALRKTRGVNGPVIETIMYLMPENRNEKAAFLRRWRGTVDHVRQIGSISGQFAQYKSGENMAPVRNRTCKNLWERMTVYWNGDVTLCIADLDGDQVMGNLRDMSVREVWNCEKMSYLKKMHEEKRFQELPLCSTCDW
jgi:radical SAM protein with 4Fe4S-binding SPASM domain